ncbi:MAG: ROK family glucokinase [Butyrivibrio sp.]|nr:ROK family glucokinase [Butyrivibrio sp.]
MKYVFGVDLGGTTVKIGLLDIYGNMQDVWEIPTRKGDGGSHILPDIAEAIRGKMTEKNIEDSEVAGVGIGVPGAVDSNGNVLQAVNLGWEKFNLKEEFHSMVKLPVKAGNDANVAALGECWKGGGKGYSNMLMATLGTGVGGGIIIDGRILNGATGSGGEIGHIHLQDGENDVCGCGNHGCFEQYASATGAVRIAKRVLEKSDAESRLRDLEEITAKDIFDLAKEGDELAVEATKIYGDYLGRGLAAVASTINPEIIVLGGGVSKCGEILFDLLKPSFEKYVFSGCKDCKFALAELGNDAGIYGAAKMFID